MVLTFHSTNTVMSNALLIQLVTGGAIGIGAGYVGSLMVLRRMSLVGDALSHVALPGIALALLWGIDPFIGAFIALGVAVAGIWALGQKTSLPSETLVGICFTLALAAGLLLTPEPELLEALFGDITTVTIAGAIISVAVVGIAIVTVRRIRSVLIVDMLSHDLARSTGASVAKTELMFLGLVALIVALGLKIAGTLLTGALVIIPAAASRNISPSLSQYSLMSAVFGGFSAVVGIYAAYAFSMPSGPLVILAGGILFVCTLPFRR